MFRRRLPRIAGWSLTLSLASLYVLSTPIFGSLALQALQPEFVEPTQRSQGVQAIVLLGGGSEGEAPEYGGDNVNKKPAFKIMQRNLARIRYNLIIFIYISGAEIN